MGSSFQLEAAGVEPARGVDEMSLRVVARYPARTALALTMAIALVAGLLVARTTVYAGATSGPPPDNSAYEVPVAVDEDPAPDVLETTLTAEETTVDLGGGLEAHVQTFNGSIPGPELRAAVDDTVIVHFTNNMTTPTGIHWHGIELDNASDGTPMTQNMVEPGDSFLYKFKVIRAGVYWYHPHHHSSSNQVFKGMYGSLIVSQPEEATLQGSGVLPPQANTRTLVLSDITVCEDGPNDAATYDPTLPWAGDDGVDPVEPLPAQPGPQPVDLCDTGVIDEEGAPTGTSLSAGDVPNIQRLVGQSNEGRTVLTNGRNVGHRDGTPAAPGDLDGGAETLSVRPGEGQRLQLVNAATVRYFRLRLTDSLGASIPLVRIGGEGGLLNQAVLDGTAPGGYNFDFDQGEILIGPGERADVVAVFPPSATGVATLWTKDFKRFGGGPLNKWSGTPTVPVAHFDVTGTAGSYTIAEGTELLTALGGGLEALGPADGSFITPAGGFDPCPGDPPVCGPKSGMASEDIQLTVTAGGAMGDTGINGIAGSHDFPGDYTLAPKVGSTRYAASVGDTLELTVTNTTAAHHPFHPHGFSMQPLTLAADSAPGTVLHTYPLEFMDSIDVPAHSIITYRIRLDDRPLMDGVTMGGATGRWVFHCHIFFHAVFGMISEIIVGDPDGNERPYVNADDVATAAVDKGGQVATMHGTYSDIDIPDGDSVNLSASKGSLTDNGDGTWDWEYTTDNSPGQAGFVYITAEDAAGKKDQVAFELLVNNAAPVLGEIADEDSDEAESVNVTATFTDADAGDLHTATIDWGDGAGPQAVTVDDTLGTLSGSHTYGDDGIFTATATVSDGDASDSESFDVVVDNEDPDGNIDETGTVLVNGVPTYLADTGQSVSFNSDTTDVGSDDLTTAWNWGSGPLSSQTSLNDDLFDPDPDPSPEINPRNVAHDTTHSFSGACLYTVTFTAADDDTGTDSDTVQVIVTGTPTLSRGAGYWQTAYQAKKTSPFTTAQLNCFLAISAAFSTVFNETRAADTIPTAYNDIFVKGLKGDMRQQLDRQLLAAWINFANGGVELNELLDTDNNGSLDTTFANVMATAEAVRNNLASTKTQLQAQRDILMRINGRDGL